MQQAGRMKRPSERLEFWRQTVAQQERSGQSIGAFCAERELGMHSFYAWRKRVRREAPVKFALVETRAETNHPQAMIEVMLATGERLRIPCDAQALRVVLGVLREARA